MSITHDELAGVVDLFGALTPEELTEALGELAFKQGQEVDEATLQADIDAAVAAYALVEYDPLDTEDDPVDTEHAPADDAASDETETLVAVGPTAFPTLPPNAEDLPHILDYDRRSVDRERLAKQVTQRLAAETAAATTDNDVARASKLLDVAYDIETWATVETDDIRSTLTAALPQD